VPVEALARKRFFPGYKNDQEHTPEQKRIESEMFERLFTVETATQEPKFFTSPEKNLWLRVFRDGLHVYLRINPSSSHRLSPIEAEAVAWVEEVSDDDTAIGSFPFVCQVLKFEPSYLRRKCIAARARLWGRDVE